MIEFLFFMLLAASLIYMEHKDRKEGHDRYR